MSLTNLQKIQKLNQQTERTRELFEQKFTRSDWDAKKPEAIKFFNKCQQVAAKEILG